MKTLIITILITASCLSLQAQSPNYNEWFRQKKTQRKYLVQQIAALKVYLQYLKKGYEIAQKGLTQIGSIKDDAFGRDRQYLTSLKQVSPVIRNSPKLTQTISYEQGIIKTLRTLREQAAKDQNLTTGEVAYIESVYSNMITECNVSMDEILMISTPDAAEMKDDERLTRLDSVHADMADKYAFARDFADGTRLLSLERAREQYSIKAAKNLIEL